MIVIGMLKKIVLFFVVFLALAGGFIYFLNRVHYSHGSFSGTKNFKIEKGEKIVEIGKRLEKDRIIANDAYFLYYIWAKKLRGKIIAGEYQINSQLTIPEIVKIITQGEELSSQVKITFPEGWGSVKMADRLEANGFSKEKFLQLVNDPPDDLAADFDFLSDKPKEKSLEGYLFPDTYFFFKDSSEEDIVRKMLVNFGEKLDPQLKEKIKSDNKTVFKIVTMASVIENEVKTEKDRKIVSGIFWKRIENGQSLESCATLAYVLGVRKKQYSYDDTRIASPYNTYIAKGLPPGPISNPGTASIQAAVYPQESDYNYFLNNPETGEIFFARTLDEHNANKAKNGL